VTVPSYLLHGNHAASMVPVTAAATTAAACSDPLLTCFRSLRTFLQKGQPWNSYSSMDFTGRLKVSTWQQNSTSIDNC
jgi:hypothetical protein